MAECQNQADCFWGYFMEYKEGQEQLGTRSCRATNVHLKKNWGQQNNVQLKYLYIHIYNVVTNLDLQQ